MRSWIVVLAACGSASDQTPPAATPQAPPSAARTLEVLRAYVANREHPEQLQKLLAPGAIATNGDPTTGTPIFGRELLVENRRKRAMVWRDRCVLEVELATAGRAVAIAHCDGIMTMKKPPVERHRAAFAAYEIILDPDAAITWAASWTDGLRTYRQLGVEIDVDPRPDEPTGKLVTAVARGDAAETEHEHRARELIAALDRRDASGAARVFSDEYTERNFHDPELRTTPPADYIAAELGECERSKYRVLSTLAAHDWVALRFGKTCHAGSGDAYAGHLWLLRFDADRVREGWRIDARYEVARQLGQLDVPGMTPALKAAGFQ